MKDNRKRAERLFLAIGQVDDEQLLSLMSGIPTPSVRKTLAVRMKRWSRAAVAAMLLIATLIAGARMLGILTPSGEPQPTETTLEELLLAHIPEMTKVEQEQSLYFFSGTPTLICRFGDREEYYLRSLDGIGKDALKLLVGQSDGKPLTPEQSRALSLRVWVCDGKGMIASPQLTYAPGNFSYGCLNDFLPEIEPSDAALRCLERYFA